MRKANVNLQDRSHDRVSKELHVTHLLRLILSAFLVGPGVRVSLAREELAKM